MLESSAKQYRSFSFDKWIDLTSIKGLMDESKTLNAVYVSAVDMVNHVVTFSSAIGKKMNANEGLMIVGTGEAGEYYPIPKATTYNSVTNYLKGTGNSEVVFGGDTGLDISGRRYFVMKNGDFYSCGAGTLGRYKSYLDLGTSSSASVFTFVYEDESPTAVETISGVTDGIGHTDSDTYYDLSGRRLAKSELKKGIYIHNGRKVVVR